MTTETHGSKGEQTREMIIRQAAVVFNQHGFFGTSISEIMQETGLEKGGIYNHFKAGKEELALAAFDYAVAHINHKLDVALRDKHQAVERLLAFAAVLESAFDDPELPGGCPILNTAIESDDAHPALRARSEQAMSGLIASLERIIDKGIQCGEIRGEIHSQAAAAVFISTMEGALMLSRLYNERQYITFALRHIEQFIEHSLRQ